jgi:16S rRNA (adenine1518-N6/adenine1519-N6)-dimethyltransferase
MNPVHRPRKRFGQHFLHDPGVIERLIQAIDPRPDDTLVEIGPGHGALTRELLNYVKNLHVVEIDRDLAAALEKNLKHTNVTIHCVDALKFDITSIGDKALRIVGNLPYNISTPLLFHLLKNADVIRDMHFMLQKEVVDRLAASEGNKQYGRLSVMMQSVCRIEKLFDVGPGSFSPPPRVESSVVRLVPDSKLSSRIRDPILFRELVRDAFNQRRKTLRNAIHRQLAAEEIQALGIAPDLRPENLTVEQYITLSNHCFEAQNS